MNKNRETKLQFLIQKYFLQWMLTQRNVSPETIKSYRDTFRIFFRYIEKRDKIKPSLITINHFEAEYILGFLEFLKKERGNKPNTINNRLAALHSFLKFISFEAPEHSGLISRSLLIPFMKGEKCLISFLTEEEFQAMINTCDTSTGLGRRDKLMLLLLYNAGVRVSELTNLKGKDIRIDSCGTTSYLRIHGKGRKERDVPLWKSTTEYLRDYIDANGTLDNDKLFLNSAGNALTRSGVRYRIDCLQNKAITSMPSLSKKKITPHTFRHTTAMNLLQSGIDISTIAIWLGHESIDTAHKYMVCDIEMKRGVLAKMNEPKQSSFHLDPDDTMLTFLDSL